MIGIRIIDSDHIVTGPACGTIRSDLGAEVSKVEVLAGDSTRRPLGSRAGPSQMLDRNKESVAPDVAKERVREIVLHVIAGADIFIENFKAGMLDSLGLGAAALQG